MKFEDWKYHFSKLPKDYTEKSLFIKKLEKKFIREIKKNPDAQKYFEQYKPDSVNQFINNFASAKARFVYHSEYYFKEIHKSPELRYRELTDNCLNFILQKKLFNLQLLWLAEKITFPEVRIFWDFSYWHHNIRNCPFLEPITQNEIDIMKEFLRSDDCDLADNEGGYEPHFFFNDFMNQDEDGDFDCMPDFFEFYDIRMGTGSLLSLPDIRGKKEDHYHILSANKRNKEREEEIAKNPLPPYVPDPPSLYSDDEQMALFAEQFEDPIFNLYFKHLGDEARAQKSTKKDERDVDDIYDLMLDIPDLPPVRGGLNWRDALYYCYNDYVHNIIADEIQIAYEEYLLFREMGISAEIDVFALDSKSLSDTVYEMILEGR